MYAMYDSPAARAISFLSNLYFPGAFNFICFKSSLHFSLALGVVNVEPRVGPRSETDHPARGHELLNRIRL